MADPTLDLAAHLAAVRAAAARDDAWLAYALGRLTANAVRVAHDALLCELDGTAGWLDELAGDVTRVAEGMPDGPPNSTAAVVKGRLGQQAYRLRTRAAAIRQTLLAARGHVP